MKNMFKIAPIQDKARQKEICDICKAIFVPDAFAYVMYDTVTGEVMGCSQFEILGESGLIHDLRNAPETDDFEAMFILGRQTMNFIDTCGAHTCRAAKNSADTALLRAIGFKECDDDFICDMAGMFDGHCDGHAVKL